MTPQQIDEPKVKNSRPLEKKDFWLYHPALVDKERGFTGRYRPALPNSDGTPQIEMEQIISKNMLGL